MKGNEAFPSEYLKAADVEAQDATLTIKDCDFEEFDNRETNKKERKPVLTFKGTDKKLILNKTNWNTISALLGSDDSDDWAGKRITLFATEVESFGKMTQAIRVRPRPPVSDARPKVQPPPQAQYEAPDEDQVPF